MFFDFIKKLIQILMKELYQINVLLLFFSCTSVTISSFFAVAFMQYESSKSQK